MSVTYGIDGNKLGLYVCLSDICLEPPDKYIEIDISAWRETWYDPDTFDRWVTDVVYVIGYQHHTVNEYVSSGVPKLEDVLSLDTVEICAETNNLLFCGWVSDMRLGDSNSNYEEYWQIVKDCLSLMDKGVPAEKAYVLAHIDDCGKVRSSGHTVVSELYPENIHAVGKPFALHNKDNRIRSGSGANRLFLDRTSTNRTGMTCKQIKEALV